MSMKEIEKDFEEIRQALNNNKRYVVCKYSLKVVEIKQILDIYNEKLVAQACGCSDGRNIQFIGSDNSIHWCNVEMMMTKSEAIKTAKQLRQEKLAEETQQRIEKINKLEQELVNLRKELNK